MEKSKIIHTLEMYQHPFYQRKEYENAYQPLCIDYPNVTTGIRKLITKTYIKWINRTSHCHPGYPIARHTSSALTSKDSIRHNKISKEKIQFITRIEREEHHKIQ